MNVVKREMFEQEASDYNRNNPRYRKHDYNVETKRTLTYSLLFSGEINL